MDEENKVVEPENKVEGEVKVEISPVEQKAREMGWRPQDEWDGEPEEWIDAKEYVGRKPLFDHMSSMKRELRETQKALKALQGHHEKVREAEYKRAIESLKVAKKSALEEGDSDKLVEIDEQLTDLKARNVAEEAAARNTSNAPHPNFVAWVERNTWYAQNPELRTKADEIGVGHAMANPNKSPDEVLEYVEREIKKQFLRNPNKDRVSAVDTASKTKPVVKKDDFVLSEEEKAVMKTLVRSGTMSEEEYIAELKRIR